ncbi:MAG: right-handed parallel beta-helix repeat-containing protein [Proteobacteria bacterium]|nr:right-handed parallel beta-helix repeat-containing protein [Pseudomonadota bacterium]
MGITKRFGPVVFWIAGMALLSVAFFVASGRSAGAAIINVPAEHRSIQEAIDAAAPGDTINVAAGTYHENITVDKPLTLSGADAAATIIDGGSSGVVVQITADDVTLSGFTVQNSGSTPMDADVLLGSFGDPVGVTGCTVAGNLITGDASGVVIIAGSGNSIFSNDIDNSLYGVALAGSSGNTIESNTVCSSGLDAIALDNAAAAGGAIAESSTGNRIKTNTVTSNRDGIFIGENCHGNFVTDGNVISNAASIGINLWRPSSQTITGNTIRNSLTGIRLLGSSNNTITGNAISSNSAEGIKADASWQAGTWYPSENNDISSNNFTGNALGINATEPHQTSVDATNNWWGCAAGPGYAGCDPVSANVTFDPFWAAPYPVSVDLMPSSKTVYPGATQQYATTGTLLDGTTADVILECEFKSKETAVATIDSDSGLATAIAAGSTAISALCFHGGFEPPRATLNVALPDQPIADAGKDQTIVVGETAILDGSASSDPAGLPLSYLWDERISNPEKGLLTDRRSVNPSVKPTIAGQYAFTLVVDNGYLDSPSASVRVTAVSPQGPMADAGPDGVSFAGDAITLDGGGSTDPEGRTLSYLWKESSANPMTGLIANPRAKSISVTLPVGGNYAFTLAVSNGAVESAPDGVLRYVAKADAGELVPAATGGVVGVANAADPLNGLKLEIPAGALVEDTEIRMGVIDAPPELDPTIGATTGVAIAFSPSGLQFEKPVTAYIPVSLQDMEAAGWDLERIFVFAYDADAQKWTAIPARFIVKVDETHYLVMVEISHFSIYQAGHAAGESTGGGCGLIAGPRSAGPATSEFISRPGASIRRSPSLPPTP